VVRLAVYPHQRLGANPSLDCVLVGRAVTATQRRQPPVINSAGGRTCTNHPRQGNRSLFLGLNRGASGLNASDGRAGGQTIASRDCSREGASVALSESRPDRLSFFPRLVLVATTLPGGERTQVRSLADWDETKPAQCQLKEVIQVPWRSTRFEGLGAVDVQGRRYSDDDQTPNELDDAHLESSPRPLAR
jgi:hypothetical protein